MKRAAFLDRDGVVNVDRDYVHRVEDFALLPGSADAMRRLQQAGFALVIVTNQGGIALGKYGEPAHAALVAHLRATLAQHGVHLDGYYHCPHHPRSPDPALRECSCRKPLPGMLMRAAEELQLDLPRSLLVGDKGSDIAAGRAAGVPRCCLVESGHALSAADRAAADGVFADLAACVAALQP